jgi:hypothetical protein
MANDPAKHDDGKPDLTLAMEAFPRAIVELSKVMEFGLAKGYGRGSWRSLPDGERRYKAAMFRHALAIEEHDDESCLLHAAHVAWNAMAVLELILTEDENMAKYYQMIMAQNG